MNRENNKKTKNRAYTLIEIMVGVAIFSLIIAASSGIFISVLKSQRRILAEQELLGQTSYVLEYMSRAMRMAKKDLNGDCISAKLNYEKTSSGIKFKNYKDNCQEFYLEGGQLKENRGGVISELTSASLKVISFNIGPNDSWDQEDSEQPKVTFFLEIEGKENTKTKIQTTISQRNLDVKY